MKNYLFKSFVCLFIVFSTFGPYAAEAAKERSPKYTFELAVCMIFQNEASYLQEWIEFHKLMGVEHFYLYNHMSSDGFRKVLQPYIERGEVELTDWPYNTNSDGSNWLAIQCMAYNDALDKVRGKVKWLAIIDSDEFLLPVKKRTIPDFLADYEDVAGVCINWQLYGTSHVSSIPPGKLMTEVLTLKAPVDYYRNYHIKSIVRPEFVESMWDPHFCFYKPGYCQVDANKEPFSGNFSPSILIDKIRINHYWSRDEHFFLNNKIPRHLKFGSQMENIKREGEFLNKDPDPIMLKKVTPKLKKVFRYLNKGLIVP